MKNNNIRKSALYLALSVAMGASAGAHAAVEIYNQDGTSFSVDGYFNAFYVNREDKLADTRNSDVKMGFLPNTIGFNFSKEMGELTLGGRSSFWSTINDSLQSPTDTAIDVRQLYATVDGSFGQVLIGKDFGLYARSNIFLDEILMGFGSPGAPTGVSFGNIRTGYPYPNPSAQITYRTPDLGGLNIAAGIFEPANTTPGAGSEQSAPRIEAEVTYSADLNGVSLTGWVNGRTQSSENDTDSVDSTGLGYGLRASVAGFSLTGSGFTSEGDVPVLISDTAATIGEEDADGYLIQGSYTLGANRFVLSYGETDSDQADYETENTSIAVFHDVNSNFKLVAEYNMFEQTTKSTGADAADIDTLALGAVVTF
ncbi:porin [Marinobacter qingdaonensis]|uniref:Porin n=1 Tax=Marinobacter qingdaonensis TaxID=3108486 RepID=A0ABU5NY42_9GAMM|nr:porin [Marinobacter sp. ASW11-75]MEA1080713.1 porin [Marinobacter sp. ASW11-75]MEE2764273.1 porin [Pseudomonadota bacterium]MEE3118112.1 porin [Pseudomonadota bacterium]